LTAIGSGEQLVNVAVWMTVDDPDEGIGQVGKRIDVIQLTGLCRLPNYLPNGLVFPEIHRERRVLGSA
jgi:hypothetical protein